MKKILIIDTALDTCQAALGGMDGTILTEKHMSMHRGHAEHIIPMIETLLADNDSDYTHIHMIAVTVGPGSFTGLRTGIAAARGLSIALNIPAIGITTLEAHAIDLAYHHSDSYIAIALDARHGNVFGQIFTSNGKAIDEPRVDTLPVFTAALPQHNILLAGSAAQYVAEIASPLGKDTTIAHQNAAPNLRGILKAALTKSQDNTSLTPLYLRPPNAKSQINKSVART